MDEAKRATNLRKHGIDFIDCPSAFDGTAVTTEDDRFDYGELRYVTFGLIEGRVVTITHCYRRRENVWNRPIRKCRHFQARFVLRCRSVDPTSSTNQRTTAMKKMEEDFYERSRKNMGRFQTGGTATDSEWRWHSRPTMLLGRYLHERRPSVNKDSTSSKSRTDWKRIDGLKDEEIDLSDTPEVTPEMFAKAVVRKGLKPALAKQQLTLRLDADVLRWFKAQGRGYQTRINALLRAYMEAHRS